MAWGRPTFPPRYAPIDEAHPFLSKDPYALSKETDERTAEMFCRRSGMTVLAYRLHWIGQPGESRRRALDPAYTAEGVFPGNASGWVTARAEEVLGFVPQFSWRDDADTATAWPWPLPSYL